MLLWFYNFESLSIEKQVLYSRPLNVGDTEVKLWDFQG